jgi:hypothetical protein
MQVFYYRPDQEARSDFSGASKGEFHKWGVYNGDSVGIVEDYFTGAVHLVHPLAIKFTPTPRQREDANKK